MVGIAVVVGIAVAVGIAVVVAVGIGERMSTTTRMKLKPMSPLEQHESPPSPVRHIKPPKRKEKAEVQTIATVLLRRNRALFVGATGSVAARCCNLISISETRALTAKEAEKAIAGIKELRSRQ